MSETNLKSEMIHFVEFYNTNENREIIFKVKSSVDFDLMVDEFEFRDYQIKNGLELLRYIVKFLDINLKNIENISIVFESRGGLRIDFINDNISNISLVLNVLDLVDFYYDDKIIMKNINCGDIDINDIVDRYFDLHNY